MRQNRTTHIIAGRNQEGREGKLKTESLPAFSLQPPPPDLLHLGSYLKKWGSTHSVCLPFVAFVEMPWKTPPGGVVSIASSWLKYYTMTCFCTSSQLCVQGPLIDSLKLEVFTPRRCTGATHRVLTGPPTPTASC